MGHYNLTCYFVIFSVIHTVVFFSKNQLERMVKRAENRFKTAHVVPLSSLVYSQRWLLFQENYERIG